MSFTAVAPVFGSRILFISQNLIRLASALTSNRRTFTQMQRLTAAAHVVSPYSFPRLYKTRLYSSGRNRNIIDILEERMLVESVTNRDALRDTTSRSLKVYCGFDPTAESLHLGNLIAIIVLSWFLRCGHQVVALVGGATGRVGDPSGKTRERPDLDPVTLEKNVSAISRTINDILGRESQSTSFEILNNYDWWKDMTFLEFLKNVGRFARIGPMMSKESVRKRLNSEQGMSYAEFTYQLIQGYDFVHLFRCHQVNIQIGGSDQWGNIIAGTDLIGKILQTEGDGAYGLTFPLLLKSDGSKFGKSEDGAIWLSPSCLSPYQFYQYLFNVTDADVIRFLKMLTFISIQEISLIEREMKGEGYVPNSAQQILAEEVTRFVHGEEGLNEALKATQALRPGSQTKLDSASIETIADGVPSSSQRLEEVLNLSVLDLTVTTGLLASKSAARRLIKGGGLYLNNKKVDTEAKKIAADDIVDGKVILLSAGKKNKMIVRIS